MIAEAAARAGTFTEVNALDIVAFSATRVVVVDDDARLSRVPRSAVSHVRLYLS